MPPPTAKLAAALAMLAAGFALLAWWLRRRERGAQRRFRDEVLERLRRPRA